MKLFLSNREEIIEVFKKLQNKNYPFTIKKFTFHKEDFSVSYASDVWFANNNLTHLPFQFRHVSGWFDISNNNLTTLIGCPETVGERFYCDYNNLVTLNGGPKVVGDSYVCHSNPLENFTGFPEKYQEILFSPTALFNSEIPWLEQRAEFVENYDDGDVLYKSKDFV
jgi:hypothetical protein